MPPQHRPKKRRAIQCLFKLQNNDGRPGNEHPNATTETLIRNTTQQTNDTARLGRTVSQSIQDPPPPRAGWEPTHHGTMLNSGDWCPASSSATSSPSNQILIAKRLFPRSSTAPHSQPWPSDGLDSLMIHWNLPKLSASSAFIRLRVAFGALVSYVLF